MDKKIVMGLSVRTLLFGAFFASAGIVFILMAFFGNYTLSFHKIMLPQWVLYLVAVIALAFGVYGMKQSFRTLKCAACNNPLEYGEALYPSDREYEIMKSYETLDPSRLNSVPYFAKGAESMKLSLDYCDRCGKIGVLSVIKENSSREKNPIGRPKIIEGDSVALFLPLVRRTVRLDPLSIDEL